MSKELSEEREIDARIAEVEVLIQELQRRRQELVEAKEALNEVAFEKVKPSRAERFGGPKEARVLDSLSWRPFKTGKEGEWVFLNDRDGRLSKELEQVKDFVEKVAEKDLIVGDHRYRLSGDKFLNRYPK